MKFVGGCLGFLAVVFAVDSLLAAILMLIMGGLHVMVSPAIPPVGFWGAFLIVLALSVVAGIVRGGTSSGSSK